MNKRPTYEELKVIVSNLRELLPSLKGLTETEAQGLIVINEGICGFTSEPGEITARTADFEPTRVNLWIKDGWVVGADLG